MSTKWLRCIPFMQVLASVVVVMHVANKLKLHLSFIAVAADYIILPCFECCYEALQPLF